MKKVVSILMAAAMILTMVPVWATTAETVSAILSPVEGAVLDSSNSVTVSGTLSSGAGRILIDGEVASDNVTATEHAFSVSINTADYAYGIHKITLECGEESIDRYVHFTSPAVSVERGTNFTGGSGATSSNMGGWGCSFASDLTVNDGTKGFTIAKNNDATTNACIGRTYQKHANGYVRVVMNNNRTSESMNTGVIRVDADIAVTGQTPGLQFAVRDRVDANNYWGGSKYYLLDGLVGQDEETGYNVFMDGTPFVSGQSYHVTILVDVDRKTRTYLIDGKPILEDTALTQTDVLDSVNIFYFELPASSSADAALTVNNLNLTTIERYPFITGISGSNAFSEQTIADLYHTEISTECSSVYIRLSNAVAAASVTNETVQLIANESAVSAEVSVSGNVIAVRPTNGFTSGMAYQISMSGLQYDFSENNVSHKNAYPKDLTISFTANAQAVIDVPLALTAPLNNAVLDSSSTITVSGTMSMGTADILIDGITAAENITGNGGTFSAEVNTADYTYGVHKITLVYGEESIDRYVYFTSPAVSVERGTNFTGGSGATSSNMGGWGCSFASDLTVNDGTNGFTMTQNYNGETRIGRTYEKHASGYIRVAMNNNRTSESMDTGVVRLEADIAVDDATPKLQFAVRDRVAANNYWGGSKYYLLDGLVGQDEETGLNVFMDGTPFVSGQSYHITVMIDVDRKTRTYLIDGKPILEDAKLTRSDVLESVDMLYFELPSGTSSQAKLTVNNLKLTTIERYPFVTGVSGSDTFSEQTAANLYQAEIPTECSTAYIRLNNAVAAETVTSETVQLIANETAVDADVAFNGNVIAVTPKNGFISGMNYRVSMSGLRYDYSENNVNHKDVYSKALCVNFKAAVQDSMEMISVVYNNGTVTASTAITRASAENTVLPDKVEFIIAVYEGSQLKSVESHPYTLDLSGTTPLSEKLINVSEGYTVKAFVWSSFSSCTPLMVAGSYFAAANANQ